MIVLTIPKLSEESQSYILGIVEGMAIMKEEIANSRKKKELQKA